MFLSPLYVINAKSQSLKRLTLEAFSYIFRQTAPYSIRVLKPVKAQKLLFNFAPQAGKSCKSRIYAHELAVQINGKNGYRCVFDNCSVKKVQVIQFLFYFPFSVISSRVPS